MPGGEILRKRFFLFLIVVLTGILSFHLLTTNSTVSTWQYLEETPVSYFSNGNLYVKVDAIQGKDKKEEVVFRGFVMLVSNPRAVKVMLPEGGPGSLQKTSEMAQKAGAVAAVNGGGFFNRPLPGEPLFYPLYYTVQGGRVVTRVDRYNSEILVGLTKNGTLVGGTFANPADIKKAGIVEGVSFRPQLIKNGKRLQKPGGKAHPRTAIGQKKNGSLLFVVIDGRRPGWSMGVTYYELQEIMMALGAYNAFNLDGGGSSTMVFKNRVLNKPSDTAGERPVATSWVIMDS